MPVVPLRQLTAIAVAVSIAGAIAVPGAFAETSVKAIFEKHDLLGTFAWDCAKPASKDNTYYVNRLLDADHVQRDRMSGPTTRDFATILDKAAESKPNEVAASGTRDGQPVELVWRLEPTRMLQLESTEAGKKTIGGGRLLATGKEMPWLNKCVQRITIQSAPDGGGRCIDVPRSELKAGVRLQMWDCNDTAAQTFSFDASSGRMTVGGLCVEASGGRGQPGDRLQLAQCNGGQNQAWKTEPNGNYVKLVGINGLCFDIIDYSKQNNAPLKIWHCHGESNQSWVLHQAVDLIYEENAWRTGNTIREFNLPAADFKLCQKSCIDDRHCTAWDYRKPEGRTDRQPHCWLINQVVKIERGSKENLVVSGNVRSEAPKPPGK